MADVKELNINNTTYDIKAKSVVDTNSGSVKMWTGTRQQYDAIVSKDANTLYNITDDTDVTLTLLEALYPVGSIYIGTMANCPLQALGVGTWQLKTSRFLVDKYSNGTEWWELYSDGWCRQGDKIVGGTDGYSAISFFKNYASEPQVHVSRIWRPGGDAGSTGVDRRQVTIDPISNTGFSLWTNGWGSIDIDWQAEGYTSTVTQFNQWERTA